MRKSNNILHRHYNKFIITNTSLNKETKPSRRRKNLNPWPPIEVQGKANWASLGIWDEIIFWVWRRQWSIKMLRTYCFKIWAIRLNEIYLWSRLFVRGQTFSLGKSYLVWPSMCSAFMNIRSYDSLNWSIRGPNNGFIPRTRHQAYRCL